MIRSDGYMKYVNVLPIVLLFGFLLFGCTGITYKVNPDKSLTVITYEKNPAEKYGSILKYNISETCDRVNKLYNTGCILKNGTHYAKKIKKADWFSINVVRDESGSIVYTANINKTNVYDILPDEPGNILKFDISKNSLANLIEHSMDKGENNITIEVEMPAKIVSAKPEPARIDGNKAYYTYAQIKDGVRIKAMYKNEGNVYLIYLALGVGAVILIFVLFSWYRAKERSKKFNSLLKRKPVSKRRKSR